MFFKYVSRIPSRFMHYIWFLCLFSHFKSRRVPPWMCVYICTDIYNICICICFCIYIYKTLLFKLLPILICLITSSWCHLPSSHWKLRAEVSDSGSMFWKEYVQVILRASLNISSGAHDVRGPIIRYWSLGKVVTTSLLQRYVFLLQLAHHSVGDALAPSENPVPQKEISWNHLSLHWWSLLDQLFLWGSWNGHFQILSFWEFPGSPTVRTPCLHCRGRRFNPWLGN